MTVDTERGKNDDCSLSFENGTITVCGVSEENCFRIRRLKKETKYNGDK